MNRQGSLSRVIFKGIFAILLVVFMETGMDFMKYLYDLSGFGDFIFVVALIGTVFFGFSTVIDSNAPIKEKLEYLVDLNINLIVIVFFLCLAVFGIIDMIFC